MSDMRPEVWVEPGPEASAMVVRLAYKGGRGWKEYRLGFRTEQAREQPMAMCRVLVKQYESAVLRDAMGLWPLSPRWVDE